MHRRRDRLSVEEFANAVTPGRGQGAAGKPATPAAGGHSPGRKARPPKGAGAPLSKERGRGSRGAAREAVRNAGIDTYVLDTITSFPSPTQYTKHTPCPPSLIHDFDFDFL